MRVMFVVINADDLGLHPAVTRAVEELAGRGRLTSASLLVNGPCAGDAGRLAGLGIGLHLNLLRGVPLGPPSETSTFTGADGVMLGRYAALFSRYLRGALDLGQVRLEWARQIERALEMGIALTHLDSEKHIHAWPGLWDAAVDLARQYRISWVRRPMDRIRPLRADKGAWRARILNVFCRASRRVAAPPASADAVCGLADQGAKLRPECLIHAADSGDSVLEVACHPGLPASGDPALDPSYGKTRVASLWREDFDALSLPDWSAALQKISAELTHFGRIDPVTRRRIE